LARPPATDVLSRREVDHPCRGHQHHAGQLIGRFGDRDKADAFLASAELRETMKSAGVIGQPRIEQFEEGRAGLPSA